MELPLEVSEVSAAYLYLFALQTHSGPVSFWEVSERLKPLMIQSEALPKRPDIGLLAQALDEPRAEDFSPDPLDSELYPKRYLSTFRRFELQPPEAEMNLQLSPTVILSGRIRSFLTLFRSGIACLTVVLPITAGGKDGSLEETPEQTPHGLTATSTLTTTDLHALALSRNRDAEGPEHEAIFPRAIVGILKRLELRVKERLRGYDRAEDEDDPLQDLLNGPLSGAEQGVHGQILQISCCRSPWDSASAGPTAAEALRQVHGQLARIITPGSSPEHQGRDRRYPALGTVIESDGQLVLVKHNRILYLACDSIGVQKSRDQVLESGVGRSILRPFEHALHQEILVGLAESLVAEAERTLSEASARARDEGPLEAILALSSEGRHEQGKATEFGNPPERKPLRAQEAQMESLLRLRAAFLERIDANWLPDVFVNTQERELAEALYDQRSLRAGMELVKDQLLSVAAIATERYNIFFNKRLEGLQQRVQELLRRTKQAQEIQLDMTRAAVQSKLTLYLLLGLTVGSALAAMFQAAAIFVPTGAQSTTGTETPSVRALQIVLRSWPWVLSLLTLAVVVVAVLWLLDVVNHARQVREWDRHHVIDHDERLGGKLEELLIDVEKSLKELNEEERDLVHHRGQHPNAQTRRRSEELSDLIGAATKERQVIRSYLRRQGIPDI